MKQHARRIGMGLLALLFIATSVGTVAYSVWQNNKSNEQAATLKKEQENKAKQELAMLETADIQNLPSTTQRITELKIVDLIQGTGDTVAANADVTVHYTGALVKSGKIFQSSHDNGDAPVSFNLNGVIKGWTNGMPGMKVGGKRRLIIPAALAYGKNSPSPDIPSDSDLVFDIELVKIGK
jgi:FKBP-type peptidyl-prolyl cis-trans isomerase